MALEFGVLHALCVLLLRDCERSVVLIEWMCRTKMPRMHACKHRFNPIDPIEKCVCFCFFLMLAIMMSIVVDARCCRLPACCLQRIHIHTHEPNEQSMRNAFTYVLVPLDPHVSIILMCNAAAVAAAQSAYIISNQSHLC